jgi:hypothetical protein
MSTTYDRVAAGAAAGVLMAIASLATWSMLLCGGHLIYTLDDPYISLGLGWHIAHGHYGLNAGELASPSSSILYPFLLAGFAWSPLQEWAPLIMNSLAAAATAALFARMLAHYSIGVHAGESGRTVALVALLCFAINIVGVVFTGLEHSLHVLDSVAIVYGLALALETGTAPRWLWIAILLNPLWRFEGAALSGLALFALALHGHRRAAPLVLVLIAAAVGGYMLAMSRAGLPPLPSSVLIKANVFASEQTGVERLFATLQHAASSALQYSWHTIFLWIEFALVLLHPFVRRRRSERTFAAVIVGTVLAHVVLGSWGWWYRYEIYLLAVVTAAVIVLWHTEIRHFVVHAGLGVMAGAAVAVLLVNGFYVRATLLTPFAGRGIYEQQFQMHRFAVDFYHRPIAVNDLGWASYRNPEYVLDLWGLGSEAARKGRLVDHKPGWIEQLTRSHGVGVAMIYPNWFAGEIPPQWRPLAELRSAHRHVYAGNDEVVTIYATSDAAAGPAMAALHEFASETPSTVATLMFTADALRPPRHAVGGRTPGPLLPRPNASGEFYYSCSAAVSSRLLYRHPSTLASSCNSMTAAANLLQKRNRSPLA